MDKSTLPNKTEEPVYETGSEEKTKMTISIKNNIAQNTDKPQQLTCQHCGHVSTQDDPVIIDSVWVGGEGEVKRNYCWNQEACWSRFDKQTNFILHGVIR
jgi:hypothetical protein